MFSASTPPATSYARVAPTNSDNGRVRILSQDLYAAEARALAALRRIVDAIETLQETDYAYTLVSFLAACYDGERHPLDLRRLRDLPPDLGQACLDYLNFDRLDHAEITRLVRGGEPWLRQCILRYQLLAPHRAIA